jgi:hypothetical protein
MLPSRLPVTLSRRRERLDRRRQPRFRGCLTLAVVVALANPLSAGQRVSNELQLKAAFLYRFPEFVEWPAPVLEGRPTIDLCVLTPNPFGRVLEQLIEGESVSGRPLAIRYVDASAVGTCHVLYVPDRVPAKRLLKRIATAPILTVGDSPRFLDEGGMVQLTVVQNRVRLEISAVAAERAGVKLSAQLLRLASNVREERS